MPAVPSPESSDSASEDRVLLSLGWRGLGLFVLSQGVGCALLMALVTWVLDRDDGLEAALRKGAWFGALMTVWWVGVVVATRFRARRRRSSGQLGQSS